MHNNNEQHSNYRRVVITGMGTVNALGLDTETSWEKLIAGVSGCGPITLFDSSQLHVHIAAELKDFDPTNYMKAKDARRRDRFAQFAVAAAQEALAHSGLKIDDNISADTGVSIGTSVGGTRSHADAVQTVVNVHPRRISPFATSMIISDSAAIAVTIEFKARGISFAPVTACSAGSDGIGMAFHSIRHGQLRAAIAGGSEAPIVMAGMAGFDRLRVVSTNNDNPTLASRPFDKNREGLVFGEGCGILILEELEEALARGASPLAEIIGYGASSDAYHLTAPSVDGSGAALAIKNALDDANLGVNDVDWISAHGTATDLNDRMETLAIKSVFGEQAYNIPISATKPMTGHMMGATGAVEAIWCVKAIHEGIIPPTINYETPDPELDLDYTPNEARQHKVDVALTSAFGFGGHNSVLIIKRYD